MLAFLRTHRYAGALIIGWIFVSWFGVDYFSRRATADYLIQERHVAGERAELLARSTSDIVGQLQESPKSLRGKHPGRAGASEGRFQATQRG